jgi:GTPase involved in cell partitioning and DNA repair
MAARERAGRAPARGGARGASAGRARMRSSIPDGAHGRSAAAADLLADLHRDGKAAVDVLGGNTGTGAIDECEAEVEVPRVRRVGVVDQEALLALLRARVDPCAAHGVRRTVVRELFPTMALSRTVTR